MATTQCPHCFTVYKISDRQYQDTQGRVRCGTCHERFSATLMEESEAAELDPDLLSLEPVSKPEYDEDAPSIKEIIKQETSENEYDFSFEGNIQSELSIEIHEDEGPTPFNQEDSVEYELRDYPFSSQESAPPTVSESDFDHHPPASAEPPAAEPVAPKKDPRTEVLINQVDQLIDDKLVPPDSASSPPVETEPEGSIFSQPAKGGDLRAWLGIPLLLIAVLFLAAALLYQLWLRQALPISDQVKIPAVLHNFMEPLITPLQAKLSEQFDVQLPTRRDLQALELMSARTRPHPTRSSTTLLKVSIANRSDIAQPLPWLELSLTDRNGQLVARRALTPEDYIYKNDTLNNIGPHELKPVTIELLTFPQQVTGYELKLLDK